MLNASQARAAIKRLMPGKEACTLYSRSLASIDGPARYTAYSLPYCRFAPRTFSEGGNPVAASSLPTADWKTGQDSLDAASAPNPKPGDIIGRADGTFWVLMEGIRNSLFQQFWDCPAQQWKGGTPATT